MDVEKAYDRVWRDGLMHKLWSMGITGRMWTWIRSFLTGRSAVINMSGIKAQEFGTEVGLPQGSVISPLLFNLYIADCYEDLQCERVKFADDGTIWITGKSWEELIEFLTRNWLQARLSVYPPQNYLKLANNFLSQTCRKFVKDIFSAL